MYRHIQDHDNNQNASSHSVIYLDCLLGRVDTSEIREAAGWDRSHAVLSYLTGPVLAAISVLAGHLKNTFVMRRGRVPDDPELLAMVFPEVPEALREMTEVRSTLTHLDPGDDDRSASSFFPCELQSF